jgi:hypothetical protein
MPATLTETERAERALVALIELAAVAKLERTRDTGRVVGSTVTRARSLRNELGILEALRALVPPASLGRLMAQVDTDRVAAGVLG